MRLLHSFPTMPIIATPRMGLVAIEDNAVHINDLLRSTAGVGSVRQQRYQPPPRHTIGGSGEPAGARTEQL